MIDLSVGTPNIPPADHVIEALSNAARDKSNYVYALSDLPRLKEAVKTVVRQKIRGGSGSGGEVVSLLGSQEGLAHIALSIVDEEGYRAGAGPLLSCVRGRPAVGGAELSYMPLKEENGYLIDLDGIPEETAKKRS